ncbi:MAG: cob(I)yrinic acid a,c-diamide adenosyltransferase [Planctomycetales bacterium]|nr:cob(I)yrinic acid a,c-diamide adenosyltransferase [Planctomycetales bacterium]
MKIYTKSGDGGVTGRLGGERVLKCHPQIEACGAVDEVNCQLGWAATLDLPHRVQGVLRPIQHELFALGAQLAGGEATLSADSVSRMEREIDEFSATLPPLTQFILPGGGPGAAALHLARATCRRAERRVVAWTEQSPQSLNLALAYLNRLGDLLFVLARTVCHESGGEEIVWQK